MLCQTRDIVMRQVHSRLQVCSAGANLQLVQVMQNRMMYVWFGIILHACICEHMLGPWWWCVHVCRAEKARRRARTREAAAAAEEGEDN